MIKMVKVSAPGKLMLFGDHAVVHNRPCIVTAVDHRISVSLNKRIDNKIVLDAPDMNIKNYTISLNDLERHMFVCGATGSGKSNFVQNFLINFKKLYDIPFLLVEFKGEYIFLQEKIEDLLIIRPGENFSLNIFNPEGANPEIHAE